MTPLGQTLGATPPTPMHSPANAAAAIPEPIDAEAAAIPVSIDAEDADLFEDAKDAVVDDGPTMLIRYHQFKREVEEDPTEDIAKSMKRMRISPEEV